jgi:hypothetical protein
MNYRLLWLACLCAGGSILAQPSEETLPYAVNWPSGLGLGEAVITAQRVKTAEGAEQWKFELKVDASVPGFTVSDQFRAVATADFCSLEFERELKHGKRASRERITFDQEKRSAVRETLGGGGKSEFSIPACAKDPLTFLFFARRELKQGRLPAAQPVFFGASYAVRMDAGGAQRIRSGDAMVDTDRVIVSFKGPKSDQKLEAYFVRDSARTPALVRLPLAVGTLTVELAH